MQARLQVKTATMKAQADSAGLRLDSVIGTPEAGRMADEAVGRFFTTH